MLSRIWEQLGLAERKPAEIYPFDPRGGGADSHAAQSRVSDATGATSNPSASVAIHLPPSGASVAAAAMVGGEVTPGPHTITDHDADVLPFAPAAARAAARRQETSELLWAAAAGAAALVALASAALATRRYKDRRMSTQWGREPGRPPLAWPSR